MIGALLALAALSSARPAAAAPPPQARASWDRHRVELRVEAPEGHHLAEDYIATVELDPSGHGWTGPGSSLADGVPFLREGDALAGVIEVGICEDQSGTCVPQRLAFAGALAGRRGSDQPLVTRPAPRSRDGDAVAHASSLDAALELAARDGHRVLLDFTAVWCPPCNLLAAEVLHDPADAELFDDIILVEVDVDDFDSWPVKDRYEVGGYPTLVLVDATGGELDRLVGYPGESAFVDWLESSRGAPPLGRLPAPEALTGPESAALATRLCGVDRAQEAVPFLTRAEAAGDVSEAALQIARLLVRSDADAAAWLAQNTTAEPRWMWTAWSMARSDAALADLLMASMQRALPQAEAPVAADLLYAMAGLDEAHGGAEQAPMLYAAAAATLRSGLSGDADLDRGHWTFLAQLHAAAGDLAGAEALLRDASVRFPDEMTFPYALAGILLDAGQPVAAVEAARHAANVAYGDNALRVAARLAQALAATGDAEAALATIDTALAAAPQPGDARVRTGRYLEALRDVRARLTREPDTESP